MNESSSPVIDGVSISTQESRREVILTNCVLIDKNASTFRPSIEIYNFASNGYNVIQGVVKTNATVINNNEITTPGWTQQITDILLTSLDNAPLTLEDNIYKVTRGGGIGSAYRHLPAFPNLIEGLEDVFFPEKDLTGATIDYSKSTHSGAYQSVYLAEGEEEETEVPAVTDLKLNLPETLYSDTTYAMTAIVLPGGTEQVVTWKSENEEVTITPTGETGNTASLLIEGIAQATPIRITVEAKDFSKNFDYTVKPYIHVESISIGSDTIWSITGFTKTLSATVLPANANNPKLQWAIDKPESAELSLADGAWTIKGLANDTVTLTLTAEDRGLEGKCVFVFSDASYTDGVFFINEDWYPTYPGSVNYLYPDGHWDYNVYRTVNPGKTLGVTTQYATIYGDKMYLINKQGSAVVADAFTMKYSTYIASSSFNGDGRSFLGVNENTGYLATSNGIHVLNLNGSNPETLSVINGTQGDANNVYAKQVGTMIRVGDRVFAVQQGAGLHVINALTNKVETTLTGYNYATITQSKDGYLWSGTTLQATGELETDLPRNIMVKIDPWTLETKEILLPEGYTGPPATWGAWQADPISASRTENVLYWKTGNKKILRYDIDTNTIETVLDVTNHNDTRYDGKSWSIYGTGFGIHPQTDELYVMISLYHITSPSGDRNKWKAIKVDPKNPGEENWKEYPLKDHYWFTALPVFPDNHTPVISNNLGPLTLEKDTSIYLRDKITDADNMDAAIIKSVILKENEELITAQVWRDSLIVTPLKEVTVDTETTFTLKANSNGKVVTKEITVTVKAGTDPGIITNPFELTRKTLSLKTGQTGQLSITAPQIYDVTWRSTDVTVAMVDGNGLVGALKAGTAKIIAEDKLRNKADTCVVTVTETDTTRPVYSLQLSTSQLILNQGERGQLQATVSPSTTGLPAVVWKSSHPTVADVTSSGNVVGVSAGAAIITATFADTLSVTCMVTVRDIKTEVEVEHINAGTVELTFPQMASASYYMLHLYKRVGTSRVPVVALKVNPNSQITIGLRSTNDKTTVTLNGLDNGVKYEADIEVLKETNGKAEVISTLYATFSGENPTSNLEIESDKPRVYYTDGTLNLLNLQGYNVMVYAVSGQLIDVIKITDSHKRYPISLVDGFYVVTALKDSRKQVFKIVVR